MNTFKNREKLVRAFVVVIIAVGAVACAKSKSKSAPLGAYGANPEYASYEVQCQLQPLPTAPSGASAFDPFSVPLPDHLPSVNVPIEVQYCDAFNGEPPHFFNRSMPAMTAVVDCNMRVVRFRTHDWQVTETATIGPQGEISADVMLINRLVGDADGNKNCWVRMLGHVTGKANCPADFTQARVDFKVSWRFDETPPEIMEPAPAGLADLRNGKHCVLRPGNCSFSNATSMGCGG